jgi:hypothetical protein
MKHKTTVYISGPITNDPDYMRKFAEAEKWIRENLGCKVINPAVEVPKVLKSYFKITIPTHADYMLASIYLMTRQGNTSVCFLDGWRKSKGCNEEYKVMRIIKMKYFYFEEMRGSYETYQNRGV